MSEKRIDVVVSTGKSRPEVEALDDSMRDLGATADRVSSSTAKTSASMHKMKPAAEAVNKSIGGLGRNAGMAGIQVQQFVGQIQGGQSAMLALSQQSADLGFVLGAPLVGAVIGIGASIASFMIPSLKSAEVSTDDLVEKLKELREQQALTAAQQSLLAGIEQKEDQEKRLRLNDIEDEIKAKEDSLLIAQDLINSGQVMSAQDLKRAQSAATLREELAKLRAEQDLLDQELRQSTKGEIFEGSGLKNRDPEDTSRVLAIQNSIRLEQELYDAARVQRLTTEAGFQTEDQERIRVTEAQKLIILQEQFEQKRALLIANNESTEALELLHQQKVTKITQDSDRARLKLSNAAEKQQLAASKQVFEQQLSSAAQSSRAMFNVNKAYQASKAAMQIPAIAQNSYEYGSAIGGPPLGAAFAAIGVAAGLSNLRAITSAKFGDTSSTNTAGVPGTPGVVNSPFASNQQAPQTPTQQRFVDIRLDDNALLTGSAVKDIISNLLGSDEDVTMQITANQNELKRIGAI